MPEGILAKMQNLWTAVAAEYLTQIEVGLFSRWFIVNHGLETLVRMLFSSSVMAITALLICVQFS